MPPNESSGKQKLLLAMGCFGAGVLFALVLVAVVLYSSGVFSPQKPERTSAMKTQPPKKIAQSPSARPAAPQTPEFAGIVAPLRGRVDVPLSSVEGRSPSGWGYKPGSPFTLSAAAPPGLVRPPPGSPVYYGEIPLAGKTVWFAITPPAGERKAVLYVDRNRDGHFGNDTPASYPGTGTWGTAALFTLDVVRGDGSTFPYTTWLWTTINKDEAKGKLGFNYYTRSYKSGGVSVPLNGAPLSVAVMAGDPSNTGAFDSGKILVDWNGNGKAEDPEWMSEGSVCRYADTVVRLLKIAPFADSVTFEIAPDVARPAQDVAEQLKSEPIKGNLPPELGRDTTGTTIDLADYKGKVVLVDFWATWCGPCLREMPHVKDAYAKFHERGFDIIGVSLDKDVARMREFLNKEGIAWRQICEGQSWNSPTAKRWRVSSIPATFLIGKDGKIVEVGTSGEVLSRAIERELAR